LCLLAGCAGPAAAPPPQSQRPPEGVPNGPPVALHFDWPVGLTARVEVEESDDQLTSQGTERIAFHSSYRMRVEAAPEGIRVVHDEFAITPVTLSKDSK